jgi:hypothetical protein
MKARVTTVLVLLLYLSVALVLGVVHHHEHKPGPSHHDDCAACVWQLSATTDVPLTFVPLFFTPCVRAASAAKSVAIPPLFAVATASRAPPASPA